MPPGLIHGQKIKIKGLGHASDVIQGVSGDLLLTVKVKQHPVFKQESRNIISEVHVSLSEAILGSKITIDTADGKLNIEVPPGTNEDDELVLKHYGMPPFHPQEGVSIQEQRGDHVVKFKVVIPKKLTEK